MFRDSQHVTTGAATTRGRGVWLQLLGEGMAVVGVVLREEGVDSIGGSI